MVDQKHHVLTRVLEERRHMLPRPARQFLEKLLEDPLLLERMHFCRSEERAALRNSVLIATDEGPCWAVLLGNETDAAGSSQSRARLALEGLDLSPAEVLDRLRLLPIWFLALDASFVSPEPGTAAQLEYTVHRLAAASRSGLRRKALLDQIDAALDAGDRAAYARLQALLREC